MDGFLQADAKELTKIRQQRFLVQGDLANVEAWIKLDADVWREWQGRYTLDNGRKPQRTAALKLKPRQTASLGQPYPIEAIDGMNQPRIDQQRHAQEKPSCERAAASGSSIYQAGQHTEFDDIDIDPPNENNVIERHGRDRIAEMDTSSNRHQMPEPQLDDALDEGDSRSRHFPPILDEFGQEVAVEELTRTEWVRDEATEYVGKLQGELARGETELYAFLQENERLRTTTTRLQDKWNTEREARRTEVAAAPQELETLRTQRDADVLRISDLVTQAEESKRDKASQQTKVQELEDGVRSRDTQLVEANAKVGLLEGLGQQLKENEEALEALRHEVKVTKDNLEQKDKDFEDKARVERVEREKRDRDLAQKDGEFAKLGTKIESLQRSKTALDTKTTTLEKEKQDRDLSGKTSLETRLAEETAKLVVTVEKEQATLKTIFDTAECELGRLGEMLAQQKKQIETLKRDNESKKAAWQDEKQAMQEQLDAKTEELGTLVEDIGQQEESDRQRVKDLEEQIKQFKGDSKGRTDEKTSRAEAVKEETEKFTGLERAKQDL